MKHSKMNNSEKIAHNYYWDVLRITSGRKNRLDLHQSYLQILKSLPSTLHARREIKSMKSTVKICKRINELKGISG